MRIVVSVLSSALMLVGSLLVPTLAFADAYTLDTCPVSGENLGSMGDPLKIDIDGREVLLCCKGCEKRIKADPAKYLAKVDKMMIEEQSKVYPIDTCVVGGLPLDTLGEGIAKIYDNRLVKFCCTSCIEKFEADPVEYTAKLDAAVIAAQRDSYPLDACVVSGEKFKEDGSNINEIVQGNRLVELCCKGCERKFAANPARYLAMIDAGEINLEPGEGSDHK